MLIYTDKSSHCNKTKRCGGGQRVQYLWERTKLGADVCRRTDNIQPMKDPKANARGSRQKVERKEKENATE
jgi:hypothetical protein